ncbi:hypothetical protein SCG7109_AW_00090 [Chlamydiales bacterium SCGC AG-110-M15]|nr:hypothetical protein SCG7109_AW_00090 [Chlamydiales bacterium SCGC AG-110-M15]
MDGPKSIISLNLSQSMMDPTEGLGNIAINIPGIEGEHLLPIGQAATIGLRGFGLAMGLSSLYRGYKTITQIPSPKDEFSADLLSRTNRVGRRGIISETKFDGILDLLYGAGATLGSGLNLSLEFFKMGNVDLSFAQAANASSTINTGFAIASFAWFIKTLLAARAEWKKPKCDYTTLAALISQTLASAIGIVGYALLVSREGGTVEAWGGLLATLSSVTVMAFWLLEIILTKLLPYLKGKMPDCCFSLARYLHSPPRPEPSS